MNDMPTETKDVMVRQSLPGMALAYREAVATMKEALTMLGDAQEKLHVAFGQGSRSGRAFGIEDPHHRSSWSPTPEEIELNWRQTAWRILVDRMELKRICSVKRSEEIDRQMADPKNLPEITEANMLAMIDGNARSVHEFLAEAVKELFDKLRPWRWGDDGDGYKTNKVYQIGERVILNSYLSRGYGRGRFHVNYHRDCTQTLRCLDNVFHLLDGKGTVPTHAGPLVDAINAETNLGHFETEYFEGRCFANCNLHLRFKRLDLLALLNAAGAGGSFNLPGKEKKRGQA